MLNAKRSTDARKGDVDFRFSVPNHLLDRWIKDYLSSLGTPVALSCWLLYEAGEFVQLVNKEIDPHNYNDCYAFRDDFAAVSFLRKSEFLKTGIDRKQVALSSFFDAEEQCRKTNNRFSNLASDPQYSGPNVWLYNATIRKIAQILGDPLLDEGRDSFVEEFFSQGAFGPGASTQISGRDTSAVRKFREEKQISSDLYRLVGPYLPAAYPLWFRDGCLKEVEFRNASKVITVPKSAKTDRTIAVEPGLNIWFQKAIGRMIRRRLGRNGLDLDTSANNEAMALKGSINPSITTVDFSSASDTISRVLVMELLPYSWRTIMEGCRSKCYKLNGLEHYFQKFSSMGNGFTFELETLIFYAAALATCEYLKLGVREVFVFGDDVTLPTQAYELYVEFCKFLGFTVNKRKSFSTSYFRESCGSYYFNGLDVKPLFLKKGLTDAYRVINFANAIRHLAHRFNSNVGCDARFEKLHASVSYHLPKALRLKGDVSTGNGSIHSNFDECCPPRHQSWDGYLSHAFVFQAVTYRCESPAVLLARIGRHETSEEERSYVSRLLSDDLKPLELRTRSYGNEVTLRSVTRIRKKRIFVRQWYNFGPWY